MTEKRFRMVNHDEYDYELDYIMDNYKRMPISDVCDLLNELYEENQRLKSSNMEYEDALARFEEENKFLRNKVATYKTGNRLLKESMNKEWK